MKIIAENLGKRFNREWIFRNFNYSFNEGNRYAITGPNGSGKSTLMQALWGQLQPSAGAINYQGIDPSEIFQHVAIATPYMDLIEEFSLQEIVQFHFKFKKCRLPADEFLEILRLPLNHTKPIAQFSSGMRQRLKLGLAFYSVADVLFLDEPCTNLDQASAQWYQEQLQQVPASTIVFVASNMESEYASIGQRIHIIDYK